MHHDRSILVADHFDPAGVEALSELCTSVQYMPELDAPGLVEALATMQPDILVVRSTRVDGEGIERCRPLALIVRAGAGYDTIDTVTASDHGVFVANCPGRNAVAVAELAWGLILCCDRRIPDQVSALQSGSWNKKEYGRAAGLLGRTLGVLGTGHIGRQVIQRAHGFGMQTIAWSRSLTPDDAEALGVRHAPSMLDAAREADVISIHLPLTDETYHLVDAAFLAEMRDGASLINTSRGGIIDEEALADAIAAKGLRVGLDVWESQPGPGEDTFSSPLLALPGVVGTHHCGASTRQAQQSITDEAVRIIRVFLQDGQVPHCINRREAGTTDALLTIRHLNRPGVLAHVFQVLSDAGLNVEDMENVMYEGANAACARIRLHQPPGAGQMEAIAGNPQILAVELSTGDSFPGVPDGR